MSRPLLTRFDERVLKDKDATKVQIPANGGAVNFYRQGATASQTKVFPPELINTLNVYDAGDLQLNDQVQVGVGGKILIVDEVLSTTQVSLWTITTNSTPSHLVESIALIACMTSVFASPYPNPGLNTVGDTQAESA